MYALMPWHCRIIFLRQLSNIFWHCRTIFLGGSQNSLVSIISMFCGEIIVMIFGAWVIPIRCWKISLWFKCLCILQENPSQEVDLVVSQELVLISSMCSHIFNVSHLRVSSLTLHLLKLVSHAPLAIFGGFNASLSLSIFLGGTSEFSP
jgi:hypothetical protein